MNCRTNKEARAEKQKTQTKPEGHTTLRSDSQLVGCSMSTPFLWVNPQEFE